jgi:hypothetical protein
MRSWAYQCQLKMKVAHYELRETLDLAAQFWEERLKNLKTFCYSCGMCLKL